MKIYQNSLFNFYNVVVEQSIQQWKIDLNKHGYTYHILKKNTFFKSMNLLCLPDEIIKNEIVPWLDVKAKSRLALSCKFIRKMVGVIKESSIYGKISEKRKRRLNRLKYKNELWDIFKEFHADGKFDRTYLSENPNITWELIENNAEFMKKIGMKWEWFTICRNPNITWEMLKCLFDGRMKEISNKLNIAHTLKNKLISGIALNPNITWEIISKHPNIFDILPKGKGWKYVSYNPNITCDILKANMFYHRDNNGLKVPWDWASVSFYATLSIDFVKKYPNIPWDWGHISQNKGITWNDIIQNPELPWDWRRVGYNSNLTWEIIENNPILPNGDTWIWEVISCHPMLTWDIIKKYLNPSSSGIRPVWNWGRISAHKSVTMEIIENNPTFQDESGKTVEIPWDWKEICRNPNLTLEFMKKHTNLSNFSEKLERTEKWNWDNICFNTFEK